MKVACLWRLGLALEVIFLHCSGEELGDVCSMCLFSTPEALVFVCLQFFPLLLFQDPGCPCFSWSIRSFQALLCLITEVLPEVCVSLDDCLGRKELLR